MPLSRLGGSLGSGAVSEIPYQAEKGLYKQRVMRLRADAAARAVAARPVL